MPSLNYKLTTTRNSATYCNYFNCLFNNIKRREIKENGNGECAERHVHAWAGERSSLGPLALRRAGQLAAHVGAPVVTHRETGTKESPRLLSYFRDGIRSVLSTSSPYFTITVLYFYVN